MPYYASETLLAHGITLPAPESVFVDRSVDLARIAKNDVVLHPGVRIGGSRTLIGEGAEIGTHGPVVLDQAALGKKIKIASGAVEGAVLLDGASLGPDAHVRPGTLLEEGASTAHGVGLKQTVLMSFVTLGSLINFCDCLMSGGRSRKDHSEVGSGFIHFNFTPFGREGDKATASIFGGVPKGVLLRSDRIFLGGSGGVVGPIEVGFGTILAAGSVYRRDYADGLLVVGEAQEPRVLTIDAKVARGLDKKVKRSKRYIGHLLALEAWYREVRRASAANDFDRALIDAAIAAIGDGVRERMTQVDRLFESRRSTSAEKSAVPSSTESDETAWIRAREVIQAHRYVEDRVARDRVAAALSPGKGHLEWLSTLESEVVGAVETWLTSIVDAIEAL
jgi:acetyltransferase-like isoleucine patch superfamily enzyme